MDHFDIILANLNFLRSQKFCAQKSQNFARRRRRKFLSTISAIKIGNIYIGIAFPQAQRAGGVIAPQANFFEILDLSKGKIDVFDAGREQPCMHKRTLYSACTTACDAHVLIRAHVTRNAAGGHIAFSHFGDAAAIPLHAGLFTSGGMLPSAKAHAYARPILLKYMH